MIESQDLSYIIAEVEKRIEDGILKRADDRYMNKDSCDRKQEEVYKSISTIEKNITHMKVDNAKQCVYLKILVGILSAIGVAMIPICLNLLFGG